jgi:N-acetylneuraminic acid mutarotase
MGADLLDLTGPPKLIKSNGDERTMPHVQNEGGLIAFWTDADTNYVEQADGSVRVAGDKYVRAGFQFGYRAIRGDDATFLLEWLQDAEPTFVPRTRASGDSKDIEELQFRVRVLSDIPFSNLIADPTRLTIDVELEELDASAVGASVQGAVRVTTIDGSFNGTLSKFVMPIDLTLVPLCSTLWDSLSETMGNLRSRDTVGNELPFELAGNYNYLNRSGYVFVIIDLESTSPNSNAFDLVATSNPAQVLPPPTASNGAHNVHVDRWAWHLEEESPADFTDSSSSEADLDADADIDQVHGVAGLAASLNPSDSETEKADGSLTFPSSTFFIETWVKLHATADATGEVYAIASIDKSESGANPLFTIERDTNGKWRVAVCNDSNTETEVISAASVAVDTWYQVVLGFYNDSGLRVGLFVDGILLSSAAFTGDRAAATGDFTLGAKFVSGALSSYLQGIIDQVVMYNGFPVVQVTNITNWIQARYSALRPDGQQLYELVATTFKTAKAGWYSDGTSLDYFPLDHPEAKGAAAIGVWENKVVVMGGGNGMSILDSVDLYDVQTNTWEAQLDAPVARAGAGFGVINGKLYIVGGWNGSAETDDVYSYDFSTKAWVAVADYPIVINGPASAVLDGKLYVCGGFTTGATETAKGYVYDPVDDTWTAIADMPAARAWCAGVGANGAVLVSGGQLSSVQHDDTYQYNPSTDLWDTKATLPSNLIQHVMINVGGVVYSFGGQTGAAESTTIDAVYRYDPLNVWYTDVLEMPIGRNFHNAAQIADGVVIVVCGSDSSGVRQTRTDVLFFSDSPCPNTKEVRSPSNLDVKWYDENDSSWAPKAFPGGNRTGINTGWINNRLYAAGGFDGTIRHDDLWIWDPIVNRWIQGPDMDEGRSYGPHGVIGNRLYLSAGNAADTELWAFDVDLYTWVRLADVPAATNGVAGCPLDGKFYVTNGSVLYEYDPATDAWTTRATGPEALTFPTVEGLNGKLYVISEFPESDSFYSYDPSDNTWATLNDFPIEFLGGRLFVYNDKLYCIVGNTSTSTDPANVIYVYDEGLDSWSTTSIPAPNTDVETFGVTVHNSRLHLLGGFDDRVPSLGRTDTHQVYPFTLQRI